MLERGKRTNERKVAEDVKTNNKTFFKHERKKRSVTVSGVSYGRAEQFTDWKDRLC